MKFRNYDITKQDSNNWIVVRTNRTKVKLDIVNPKTREVLYQKGEMRNVETHLGFFPDVGTALKGVVTDCAGHDCSTIEDLAKQIQELRNEMKCLLDIKK